MGFWTVRDKPEDVTDVERAILFREPARTAPKIGRNDCGG
jgi:hypothetical protein